ncbi:MAG: threonine ammonia-lyase [Bdellovibrionia bacterium]
MSRVKPALNVTLADIQEARKEIQKHLPPSPLLYNPWLSDALECRVYLKLENMQPIGSFKIRGATYKISQLSRKQKSQGVIAASAGNHAQGVAWASAKLGTHACIVMSKSASIMKIQNTQSLGAQVILQGQNYDQACAYAKKVSRKQGRILIHAFDDPEIIAGQGTVALEILEQLPQVDYVVGSVGGGGLMSGVATVFEGLSPKTQVVACQAARASSMIQSIRKGRSITLESVDTFADGIAVMKASDRIRRFLSGKIDEWVEVEEDAIAASVLMLIEKAKIIAEGSCAVPLAALEQLKKKIRGKKVVLIISGGNIDVNLLSRIIDRGLVCTGRRVRLNVLLADRPGSLAKLTSVIAQQGANILQAIHDRNEPSVQIDQTDVALTLETRGVQHTQELLKELRKIVLRLEVVR